MAFCDAIKRRADILRKRGADISTAFLQVSRDATIRAIATATEKSPPIKDELKGVGTQSGGLRESWATDGITVPEVSGAEVVTWLNNNQGYASYVNDGHRMDKHFVKGLIINPATGKLEKVDPAEGTGIMVGTKTHYVPGRFMKEAGVDTFEDTSIKELTRLVREVFRD